MLNKNIVNYIFVFLGGETTGNNNIIFYHETIKRNAFGTVWYS